MGILLLVHSLLYAAIYVHMIISFIIVTTIIIIIIIVIIIIIIIIINRAKVNQAVSKADMAWNPKRLCKRQRERAPADTGEGDRHDGSAFVLA